MFADSGAQNRLYLNDGSGTFTDVTAASMPPDSGDSWAVAAADVDGDIDVPLNVNGYLSSLLGSVPVSFQP